MDFGSYQKRALLTDQVPDNADDSIVVPLLGLAGEAGELLSEYKKRLRDGNAHQHFKERATEELGICSGIFPMRQASSGLIWKRSPGKTWRNAPAAGAGLALALSAMYSMQNFPTTSVCRVGLRFTSARRKTKSGRLSRESRSATT